jgi:hypothetical protein
VSLSETFEPYVVLLFCQESRRDREGNRKDARLSVDRWLINQDIYVVNFGWGLVLVELVKHALLLQVLFISTHFAKSTVNCVPFIYLTFTNAPKGWARIYD